MKKVTVVNLMIVLLFVASCGTVKHANVLTYIKVYDSSSDAHFTNEQLVNMMNQDAGYVPSVVVRNIYSDSPSDILSNANTHKMCSILEMGMAKNNFDVRDRGLFNNILASMEKSGVSVDYNQLYEQTHVDLLLEITSYDLDIPYMVDKYYVGDNAHFFPLQERIVGGKKIKYHPVYKLRGMNITIKVIMLKDNLIGGSYSFTYVPCSAESGGGLITSLSPLRYRPAGSSRDVDAYIYDNDQDRKYSSSEKLDILMEEFVSNTVVPKMVAFMKGDSYTPQVENAAEKKTPEVKQNNPADTRKTSMADAIKKTNIPSVDMSLPLFNVSSTSVSEYREKLSDSGRYSESEIDDMIAEQMQENKRILTSVISGYVVQILKTKEGLHAQLQYATEKSANKIRKKLENNDIKLNNLGYVDFNDYSYLSVQSPNVEKDTDSKGDREIVVTPDELQQNTVRTADVGTRKEHARESKSSDVQPVERDVKLVNSNENVSSAISELISLNFRKQSEVELAGLKKNRAEGKKAELTTMNSDAMRLAYLEESFLTEICKFTLASVYAVGDEMPVVEDCVVLFMGSSPTHLVNDAVFVFLDGKCVGAGTADLGFYVAFPFTSGDKGFHELKIMSCPEDGSDCKELFHSSVMFGVKKYYHFQSVEKAGKLIEITLQ